MTGKLKRLQAAGWKVGTAKDFLGLSREEAALVELRLSLVSVAKQAWDNYRRRKSKG